MQLHCTAFIFGVRMQLSKQGYEEFQWTNCIIAIVFTSGKLLVGNVGGSIQVSGLNVTKCLYSFSSKQQCLASSPAYLTCALLTNEYCFRYGSLGTGAYKSSLGSVQDSNPTFLFNLKPLASSHGCENGREYLQFC
jgi:hypothetical protein